MQERVSKCTKALYTPLRHSRMNQARLEEEEKERKRDRKDRGQEDDGKKAVHSECGKNAVKCNDAFIAFKNALMQ